MFFFLSTADWTQPSYIVRQLAIPVAAFVLAFATIYYIENDYNPAHVDDEVRELAVVDSPYAEAYRRLQPRD